MTCSPKYAPLPYRLLVVDSERLILDLLGEVLGDEGMCPTLVADLPSALAVLAQERFDVILTDTFDRRTSDVAFDRWATVNAVKAAAGATPVLIFSAHPPSAFAGARARGFAGFVAKPFDLDALAQTLRICVESARCERACTDSTLAPT
jgi:two-component system capsular synthesis sensor histidine kinase RcsC